MSEREAGIRDLIADDDFVVRVARATGIPTWANSADISGDDTEAIRHADEQAREKAIDGLRDALLEAFEGYAR